MKNFIFQIILSIGILFIITSGSLNAQENANINLPIEVLGSQVTVKKVDFPIGKANDIRHVFLQIHRPGYRNSLDIGDERPKVSVKINSGSWTDIKNENVNVYQPEKSYGGINGGYHTVRFSFPVDNLVKGDNSIRFRFNGTDGFSTGFRVVKFNFIRSDKSKVWNSSNFIIDDPLKWTPPLTSSSDINTGKNLWYNKRLEESALNNSLINAKCTSCHAQDGRDLKYFNYSNYSIIQRSKFHGLTDKESKQIASYIRSLKTPSPKQARPYNPPYQPGPDLKNRPVEQWAAGAGLSWVLDKDSQMKKYLFPYGTSQSGISRVIDHKSNLDVRSIPIAIQFPDWNSWLPAIHPVDLWNESYLRI